jgi:hypothetical protein
MSSILSQLLNLSDIIGLLAAACIIVIPVFSLFKKWLQLWSQIAVAVGSIVLHLILFVIIKLSFWKDIEFYEYLLCWAYLGLLACALTALVFPAIQMFKNLKKSRVAFLGIGLIVVVFALCYTQASAEPFSIGEINVTGGQMKLVEASLYAFYIMFAVSVLCILTAFIFKFYSSFRKKFDLWIAVSITAGIVIVACALIFFLFGLPYDYWIYLAYLGLLIAIIAALVFPLIQMFRHLKTAKTVLIGIAGVAVFAFVCYLLAPEMPLKIGDIEASGTQMRLVEASMFAFYALFAAALLAIVYSSVSRYLKQ